MLKVILISGLLLVLVVSAFAASCGSKSATPTTMPTSTPTATAVTFAQMADAGKAVFASHCSKCHGDQGQGVSGPAIIGSAASLGKYNTGQGLFNFVSTVMPASNPGSLSHQDYLDVVSYLLVQNNEVSADTTFNESQLGNIALK
jgi:polar amino acid transport system substrate-binding protein